MRRERIPHGKLLPAHRIKSGMTIWHEHGHCFRTVQRTSAKGESVDLFLSNGLGTTARRTWINRDKLVFVKITVRAARRNQEQSE